MQLAFNIATTYLFASFSYVLARGEVGVTSGARRASSGGAGHGCPGGVRELLAEGVRGVVERAGELPVLGQVERLAERFAAGKLTARAIASSSESASGVTPTTSRTASASSSSLRDFRSTSFETRPSREASKRARKSRRPPGRAGGR